MQEHSAKVGSVRFGGGEQGLLEPVADPIGVEVETDGDELASELAFGSRQSLGLHMGGPADDVHHELA